MEKNIVIANLSTGAKTSTPRLNPSASLRNSTLGSKPSLGLKDSTLNSKSSPGLENPTRSLKLSDASAVSIQMDAMPFYQSSEEPPPIIEIGTALTLTCCGKHHSMGQVLRRGYEMFFNWVNSARGGVDIGGVRHNIKLTLIDDQSNEAQVTEITNYLVRRRGIKLLLGPYSSTLTERAARVADSTGAVLVAPGSSESSVFINRSSVFGTLTPSSEFLQSTFTSLAGRTLSVGYIAEDTVFTKSTCSRVEELGKTSDMVFKGGFVIPEEADDNRVLQEVQKLMQDPPEFLVGCTYYNVCTRLIKAAQKLGFSPKAMLLTICVTMPTFMQDLGEAGRYVLGASQWSPMMKVGSGDWTAGAFAEKYLERYGEIPPYQAASAWASSEALVLAMEFAGSADPYKVMGALRILEAQTLFGRVAFDPNGQTVNIFNAVQFPQEGTVAKLVIPESRAEQRMIYPFKKWEERPCLQRNLPNLLRFGYNSTGHCALCPPNAASEFNNKTLKRKCRPCPLGFLLTDANECIVCGKGELPAPDGKGCLRCKPGTYKDPSGINPETGRSYRVGDRCTACDAGFYQDQEAQEECKPCIPGTFAEQPGSQECTRCAPLTRHPFVDAKLLEKRPFRFFCRRETSTTALVSECDKCTTGISGAIKDAAICCDYSLAQVQKTLSKEFGKEVRYCSHGDPASVPPIFCSKAEKPLACPDTPQHNPQAETFYQPFPKSSTCMRCPMGTLCEAACPESNPNCTAHEVVRTTYDAGVGYYVMRHAKALELNPSGIGPFKCITPGACIGRNKCRWDDESKHQGILCTSCAPGYTTKSVYELCTKCPDFVTNVILAGLGVFFLSMYIGIQIYYYFKAAHDSKALESIILKLFISYCQMTATACTVAKIGLEDYMSWYIGGLSFLSQDPIGVLMSLDCLFDLRGNGHIVDYAYLWMAMFMVPCTVVLTWLMYTVGWAIRRRHRMALGKDVTKWHPKMYISIACIAVFFTHPIATQYFLSVFDCGRNNPGTKHQYDVERLTTNLDVDCTSDEHLAMQNTAIIGIVVISFGVPVFFWGLLYVCRARLQTNSCLKALWNELVFLYNGFEPQAYYFEAVIMFRKVIFVICAVIPGLADDGRATVLLCFSIIYLEITKAFEPWDDRSYDILDRIERHSLRAVIILLLARLVQAVTDTSYRFNEESVRHQRDIVLQVVVLLHHLYVLYLMWWALFRDRVRPYLVRCKLMKIQGTVDLDKQASLDATKISEADRNVLVMIYGDAVDFLLDSVKQVDLRDLRMVITGAVTIANADKVDKVARDDFEAVFQKELRKQPSNLMERRDIPGLVDRDSTTMPTEILLGPLTVQELHMAFMYLLNQMPNLDMSFLERYDSGEEIDWGEPSAAIANFLASQPMLMAKMNAKKDKSSPGMMNTILEATKRVGLRFQSANNDLVQKTNESAVVQKMANKWKQKALGKKAPRVLESVHVKVSGVSDERFRYDAGDVIDVIQKQDHPPSSQAGAGDTIKRKDQPPTLIMITSPHEDAGETIHGQHQPPPATMNTSQDDTGDAIKDGAGIGNLIPSQDMPPEIEPRSKSNQSNESQQTNESSNTSDQATKRVASRNGKKQRIFSATADLVLKKSSDGSPDDGSEMAKIAKLKQRALKKPAGLQAAPAPTNMDTFAASQASLPRTQEPEHTGGRVFAPVQPFAPVN